MDLGNGVEINFSALTDEQLQAARTEVAAVGEARGLWVPEGAGSLAVATEVEVPAFRRAQLLASAKVGASLFNIAVEHINSGRKKKDHIPVTPAGEYRERAEDWLTEDRVEAALRLPKTDQRPHLVIPRLNRPISREEVVDSWQAAADGRLWSWGGRMDFLSKWTADQLSGFDPEQDDADRLMVLPTAYDEDREGTVKEQTAALETLQAESPELDVATIFDGAVLARRYMNQPREWRDSYVRAINLEPAKVDGFDYVPDAYVYNGGYADVDDSLVRNDSAARLQVR